MHDNHRVAIITGISGGIGRAIAEIFAQNGISLVGVARNEKKIKELFEQLCPKYKIDYLAIPTDVSVSEQLNNMVTKTIEKFKRIDFLINNAGIGSFDYIIDSKLEDFQKMIDINLKGTYLCSKTVLSHMIKQKKGKIINISSICGLRGSVKCAAYCASKFGVMGFTEVLAQEVKPFNIKVFAICPDIVDTAFANSINYTLTEKSNMLKPRDVAGLVLNFIKSEAKSQICEISLKPLNMLEKILRRRKVIIKKVKYL